MGVFKSTLGWALGGFAATPLVDYAWHAWIAHGRRPDPSRTTHLEHHRTAHEARDPWEEIRENAPRIAKVAAGVTAALAPFVGLRAAAPLSAGLVASYAAITVFHARYHERAPRGRMEEWMWRFHFHHHYGNPRRNYGLTTPIFDFVFGTAEVPREVALPEDALPSWWRGEAHGFRVRPRGTARRGDAAAG